MGEALLARLPYIIVGLLVWFVLYIAGRAVSGAFRVAGKRTRLDPILARLLGRLAGLVLSFLGLLIGAASIPVAGYVLAPAWKLLQRFLRGHGSGARERS